MLACVAVLSSGCDDDAMESLGSPIPSRPSPEELLTVYMEKVFAQRDSAGVADMIHEEFSCNSLQEGKDSLRCDSFIGRTLYLNSVGTLFRDPTVIGIDLDVTISSNRPSTNEACLDCRLVNATCTARFDKIGVVDEPVSFTVDAPVAFYIKRDPRHAEQWVLWSQTTDASFAAIPLGPEIRWLDCCTVGYE